VQFWRHASKERLVDFYRHVLDIGVGLPEAFQVWGADTVAIEELLAPMAGGTIIRNGLTAAMIPFESVIQYLEPVPDPLGRWRPNRIVDFKYMRKLQMRQIFDMLFKPNEACGMVFPVGDRFMASQVKGDGNYQRSHLDEALSKVKNFRTAIDGGAHVGTWSIPMAKRFHRVLAFEPSLDTFEALMKNLASHGSDNVQAFYNALGTKSHRVRMTITGFDKAIETGNLGARFVAAGDDVDVITIDSLELKDLDFLKLDVEGSEVAALKGAQDTLRRCKPLILFEDKGLWKRYGLKRNAPQEFLASLGAHKVARVSMDEIWSW
jgi:FkbM family methyltransferase